MKENSIKEDHMSYVSSILDCKPENLFIENSSQKDLATLQKFATLNFKDNSQAHLYLGERGRKYINMKNTAGIELLISAND